MNDNTAKIAEAANTTDRQGVVSKEAKAMLEALLAAPSLVRRDVIRGLSQNELTYIMGESIRYSGTAYYLWHDTPSGFVEDVVGETIWSKQRDVLDAIATHKRTIVPAGFGVGKTHLAGRAAAWFVCTQPPGIAECVTTATRLRQVKNQLWPHIRQVHAKAKLPGHTDQMQWKMTDQYGSEKTVAYGFSAPDNDEAAMQGIHAIKLLLIVDEAGGISKMVGEGTNNLLTGDARMLAIGNPAMDDPGSWFEKIAMEGYEAKESTTTTIQIATHHSPQITGEVTPFCTSCPPAKGAHPLSDHLPDQDWMDRTVRAYGEDHPYVIAKVRAEFPKEAGARMIPSTWVEAASDMPDPEGDDYVALCDLDLPGEDAKFTVKKGSWVRLGIDVAAAGGDEFAIYRAVGDTIAQRHVSSGSANSNSMVVAQKCLAEIRSAEALARALGSTSTVRVKIDSIGVGWGVYGILKTWGEDNDPKTKHSAQIVAVNVSENPEVEDEAAEMRPNRKRDEMWLAGRSLTQPHPKTKVTRVRLRLDEAAGTQLSVPNFGVAANGRVVVETKDSMKKRGRSSPDRAEAALLSVYEPYPIVRRRNRGIIGGSLATARQ